MSKDEAKTTYTLKSGSYNFTVNMTVGIDKLGNGDYKINPNPVSQVLNIAKEAIDYRISDMSGNFLLNGNGVAVDVSKLSTGVYLLHSGKAVQKFIKE